MEHMPKIYRVMKEDGHQPLLGETASTLGVRVPADIQLDVAGNVSPGTGGMSVCRSVAALNRMPARMIPSRLRAIVPGAAGNDNLFVWSLGQNQWSAHEESVAAGLQLRPDASDRQHGFVEPDNVVSLEVYREAIAATQSLWQVDEV